MTDYDPRNNEISIEDRLSNYGNVLQAHLDGMADDDHRGAAVYLVDAAPATPVAKKSKMAPSIAAVVSIAAALLLLVGVVVPGLNNDDPNESIRIADIDVADEPDTDGGTDADDASADNDKASDQGEKSTDAVDDADSKPGADADDKDDWSGFTVKVGDDPTSEELAEDGVDDATSEDDPATSSAALGAGDEKGDDAKSEESKADETNADEDKADDGKTDEPKADDGNGDDSLGGIECPGGAVEFDGGCYEVVPPSCGDLAEAPNGAGCLKLVGSAGAQAGGCTSPYQLQGDECVKLLQASVSCAEGAPSGDACLIKQAASGGLAGCSGGQLEIGGDCYELSAPASFDCGGLESLGGGQCRKPVSGDSVASCPSGFDVWGDVCYRYEASPTYDCPAGESQGDGWCKITESGTPGPDVCDDGVQQDEAGCFILVDKVDGSCGEYEPAGDQCRKPKPSHPTSTCPDGSTTHDNTCFDWVEATVTCAAGEPVDGGAKCKSVVDPITTDGCPDYAEQDGQGCYKVMAAAPSCGELHVAPDGENCKQWVSSVDSSGGECPSGFDLVGSYCKKYVEGTPSCSGAELVYSDGQAKCRYTADPAAASSGCAAGQVEEAGQCFKIVAPSCNELDADFFGDGCKKPVAKAS